MWSRLLGAASKLGLGYYWSKLAENKLSQVLLICSVVCCQMVLCDCWNQGGGGFIGFGGEVLVSQSGLWSGFLRSTFSWKDRSSLRQFSQSDFNNNKWSFCLSRERSLCWDLEWKMSFISWVSSDGLEIAAWMLSWERPPQPDLSPLGRVLWY